MANQPPLPDASIPRCVCGFSRFMRSWLRASSHCDRVMQILWVARRLPIISSFSQITGSEAVAFGLVEGAVWVGCCGCDCAVAGDAAKAADVVTIETINNFIAHSTAVRLEKIINSSFFVHDKFD